MASDEAVPPKKRVLRFKRVPPAARQAGQPAIPAAPLPPSPPPVSSEPRSAAPPVAAATPPVPPVAPPTETAPRIDEKAIAQVVHEQELKHDHDETFAAILPELPPQHQPQEKNKIAEPVALTPEQTAQHDHDETLAAILPELPPQHEAEGAASAPPTPPAARRTWMQRGFHAVGALLTFFLIVCGVTFGAIAWQLSRGPISLDIVTELVSVALEKRFGNGFDVDVVHTDLRNSPEGLVLGIEGVTIRDMNGNIVISSPEASIALDISSLLSGQFQAREIQFIGLAVAVTILPNGQLAISATAPSDKAAPAPVPAPATPAPATSGSDSSNVAQQMLSLGAFADMVAGRTGPLAILDRAAIRQGSLTLTDMRRNRSVTYSDLAVNFSRPEDATETRLAVSARGPNNLWSVNAAVIGAPGQNKRLRFMGRDLVVSEILGFAEPGLIPVHTDMPISLELAADFAADNTIMAIDGQITGGRTILEFQNKAAQPLRIEQLQGAFNWDRERHLINLRNLDVSGGGSRLRLTGTVIPPTNTVEPWVFKLSSQDSTLREESARNHKIELDNIVLAGRIAQGFGGVRIDEFRVTGPEVSIDATATVGKFEARDGFLMSLNARRMPALALLSFWPTFIVPDIRAYFLESVKGGRLERFAYTIDMTRSEFADAFANRPVPDNSALLEIDVSDVSFVPQPGLPMFRQVEAKSRTTGRTVTVNVSKGQIPFSGGRAIALGETTFRIGDVNALPPQANIVTKVTGGVEAFAELFKSEMMRAYYKPPFEPSQVKGQMAAQVNISFPLVENPPAKDVLVTATGNISGLIVDRVIGRDKLENGQFTFVQDKTGLVVKGEARIASMPSTLELRHPISMEYPEINLVGAIDDAARARKGFKFGNQLTGIVGVKAQAREFGGPKQVTNVEVDLTKAGINGVIPGWVKPAGKAGKATFRLATGPNDTMVLDDLMLDGGNGVSAKGDVTLTPDGQLFAAKLSSLKMSPGDNMTLDAERKDNVLKMTVRASTIDLRAELKTSFAPAAPGPGSPINADIDLDMKATAATGFNNETITALDLKLTQRDGAWRDLKMSGKLGRASVIGQNARNEQNQPIIAIETNDAGALLRYLDLYRRMAGGNMLLQFAGRSDEMKGSVIVRNFALRDDPALANVAASSKAAGRQTISDPTEVPFAKMRADFAFDGGRIAITDATLSGPQVGGTLEGTLDFPKDRADLSGTFVPAYGLNNAFNHIPIVGQLLGGKDEGLFAINFRVTGALSQPTVTVNPLSAVAPGFLRKFFGVWGSNDNTPSTSNGPLQILPPVAPAPDLNAPATRGQ